MLYYLAKLRKCGICFFRKALTKIQSCLPHVLEEVESDWVTIKVCEVLTKKQ